MQVISELISGVRGAELGSAAIYVRATSTPATVYADYDGLVALAQPLDLDSFGGIEVYVNEEVDVRVSDEDGTVIRSFSPMQTANSVEYIGPSFTGHRYSDAFAGVNQPTTVQEILDGWITSAGMPDFNVSVGGVSTTIENAIASFADIFINVKAPAYGAVGDNSSDDTVAVQAALTAAGTTKGIVFFPAGTYKITAKLTVPIDVSMWGLGPGASAIVLSHATANLLEYGAGTAQGFQEIRGLTLLSGVASTGKFIDITAAGARRVRMVNCLVTDTSGHQGNQVSVDGVGGVNLGTLEVESSAFVLVNPPVSTGCITADNANSRLVLLNSTFYMTGTGTAANFLVACRKLKSIACIYDMANMSSGTYFGLSLSATTQASIVGNEFIPGSGTSSAMVMASNTSTTRVFTTGNIGMSTFTVPFSGFVAGTNNPQIYVGERDSLARDVSSNASPFALDGHLYGLVAVTRTGAGAQQFTSTVGPPGARLVLQVANQSGGALGANPTFGAGFYVGTPAMIAPTNNKISVATFEVMVQGGTVAWYPAGAYITDI